MLHVLWPAGILIAGSLIVLSVWTALGSNGWERVIIDEVTGESIGRCNIGEGNAIFVVPLVLISFVPSALTCVMAWKTSDVDDLYSESKWIFSLVLVQLQVMVFRVSLFQCWQAASGLSQLMFWSL